MEVLTVTDVKKILKVSRSTVMSLLESSKIKSVRAGARWLITRNAVDDFLNGK